MFFPKKKSSTQKRTTSEDNPENTTVARTFDGNSAKADLANWKSSQDRLIRGVLGEQSIQHNGVTTSTRQIVLFLSKCGSYVSFLPQTKEFRDEIHSQSYMEQNLATLREQGSLLLSVNDIVAVEQSSEDKEVFCMRSTGRHDIILKCRGGMKDGTVWHPEGEARLMVDTWNYFLHYSNPIPGGGPATAGGSETTRRSLLDVLSTPNNEVWLTITNGEEGDARTANKWGKYKFFVEPVGKDATKRLIQRGLLLPNLGKKMVVALAVSKKGQKTGTYLTLGDDGKAIFMDRGGNNSSSFFVVENAMDKPTRQCRLHCTSFSKNTGPGWLTWDALQQNAYARTKEADGWCEFEEVTSPHSHENAAQSEGSPSPGLQAEQRNGAFLPIAKIPSAPPPMLGTRSTSRSPGGGPLPSLKASTPLPVISTEAIIGHPAFRSPPLVSGSPSPNRSYSPYPTSTSPTLQQHNTNGMKSSPPARLPPMATTPIPMVANDRQ